MQDIIIMIIIIIIINVIIIIWSKLQMAIEKIISKNLIVKSIFSPIHSVHWFHHYARLEDLFPVFFVNALNSGVM